MLKIARNSHRGSTHLQRLGVELREAAVAVAGEPRAGEVLLVVAAPGLGGRAGRAAVRRPLAAEDLGRETGGLPHLCVTHITRSLFAVG